LHDHTVGSLNRATSLSLGTSCGELSPRFCRRLRPTVFSLDWGEG